MLPMLSHPCPRWPDLENENLTSPDGGLELKNL